MIGSGHDSAPNNPNAIGKNRTGRILIIASIATVFLYFMPFMSWLAYPFMLVSTLVHEMGHGIAAMLVGGHFISFNMWANGSGVANINGDFSPLSRAFVAASGLVGPAIVAAFFFQNMVSQRRARIVLALFAIALCLAELLVVRNLFGLCFIAIIAAACFYFSLGQGKVHAQLVLAFLAVQLALSVFSRSDYLFVESAQTSAGPMPSDVAQMADALMLPYWFWGSLCGIFSVAVLVFGIKRALRNNAKIN